MKGIQDTSSSTLRQLLGNGLTYEIPKFQRDYSWENEQWGEDEINSRQSQLANQAKQIWRL